LEAEGVAGESTFNALLSQCAPSPTEFPRFAPKRMPALAMVKKVIDPEIFLSKYF
jgi:hypothetical protein